MQKKKLLAVLLVAAACLLYVALRYEPQTKVHANQPDIYAEAGIAIDLTSGEVLYGKNEHRRLQPGSLAKLMTSLILLEQLKPEDEITITRNALETESGSKKIMLQEGERLKRDQALRLMLVISVDTVAQSIAEQLAGSKEAFAKEMNERAKKLGIKHPSFQNASGKEENGQNLSAYDLALIAKELLQHKEALDAMGTVTTPIETSLQTKEISNNGRKDLFEDKDAVASKSGRTDIDGYTLAALYKKNGKNVLSIVLRCDEEHLYEDAATIAQYAASLGD